MSGIKVAPPPKVYPQVEKFDADKLIPSALTANYYMAPTVERLSKEAKPGDIGIVADDTLYMFSGENWVQLQAPVACNTTDINQEYYIEPELHDIECPSCGAKRFKPLGSDRYECEYCGNVYFIKGGICRYGN